MRMWLLFLYSPVVWYHTLQNVIPDKEHRETAVQSVLMIFSYVSVVSKKCPPEESNLAAIKTASLRFCKWEAMSPTENSGE